MNDTIHTRRAFLGQGLTLLSAGVTVPIFLDRTAFAMADPAAAMNAHQSARSKDDPILVVVQLAGGNDGLNTVIPIEDDRYYKGRPQLAIRKNDALRLSDDVGINPNAKGLKQLFDDGLLAVVQGVGYPNPNRSHFVSTDIWSTASPDGRQHDGWIGRYVDCTCDGTGKADPKLGIAITEEVPLAMHGARYRPVNFASPDELSWRGPAADGVGFDAFRKLNSLPEGHEFPTDGPWTEQSALAFLQRIAMDARASATEIQDATGNSARARRRGRGANVGGYEGGGALGQQLAMVRRMIAAGLSTRVYYVSMGGFDTHANQLNGHNRLLSQLSAAVQGFMADLKNDGLLDRVLLMTFSEFGRRVTQNASQGTDHGTAAPLFLAGGAVKPGLHGAQPSLEPDQLDAGDLRWNVDFRSIYAAILNNWFRVDASKVLRGRVDPLNVLK